MICSTLYKYGRPLSEYPKIDMPVHVDVIELIDFKFRCGWALSICCTEQHSNKLPNHEVAYSSYSD